MSGFKALLMKQKKLNNNIKCLSERPNFSMVEDKNSSLRSTSDSSIPRYCLGCEDGEERTATKKVDPELSLSARTIFVSIMIPRTNLNC